MRWLLVLLLVACREDAPATRPPAPPAPLPPLDPTLRITIEPGYGTPKQVLLRTEEPGAAWQEIALTGRVYRAPRPTTTFSVAVVCETSAHVMQLGPADRYSIEMPCPLIDGESSWVKVTSDRPQSFLALDGPYGIGRLSPEYPEETISVPARGAWDIIATDGNSGPDNLKRFSIARGLLAGNTSAYRFTDWYELETASVVVGNLPLTGTWSVMTLLETSHDTNVSLQRSRVYPATPPITERAVDVLLLPRRALVAGDCMQIFVDACAGSWCRASSSCTREVALHDGPTAPITRVPGPGVVVDVGSFHAADIVNVRSTGRTDKEGFEVYITTTRAWLAAHAPDGRFTVPVVPGFADAANENARYVWLALIWGLAPTAALPYGVGSWQRATTSIDLSGGPRPP